MRSATFVVASIVACAASSLPAQNVTGSGGVFTVVRRTGYEGATYEQTGVMYGAAGEAGLGPVTVAVSSLMGKLTGDDGDLHPPVDVRSTSAALRVRVVPWLALGVQVEARRLASSIGGTSVWRLIGPQVLVTPPLGVIGLQAIGELSYFPSASVTNGPEMTTALRTLIGAGFASRGGGLSVRVGYRFERYDVSDSGNSTARLEQFGGVVAEVGFRLGR